ncbi:MAG: phospho-sugar mutase [Acidimicrobiales bacterium]
MDDGADVVRQAATLVGEDLAGRIGSWVADDPDPVTRTEVHELITTGDADGLVDRFGARLEFGTAGLRGALGAGPNRMNRLVVRHAAAGLMAHLPPGARVVVGRDARHGSRDFADDTARVVAAAGGTALVLPGPNPTPLVPFAVGHLGADAGVMVTASHNPPQDNGYKVYLGDGAQIVPPVDAEIATRIDQVAAGGPVPLAEPDADSIVEVGPTILAAYLDAVARCRLVPDAPGVAVVYTAMHGVGRDLLVAAFERVGFAPPVQVDDQVDPDPDFPTVSFPNPEEPGALDHAVAVAERAGSVLVIAHDPDADRLGIAVLDRGRWRVLTGNEIGALLGDHILANTAGDDRMVATTIVSSRLLSRLAGAEGVRYVDTLTGFKWIARAADGADPPSRLVFGYEEALGYAVSPEVRDKDGITAAVVFVELAGVLADQGRTVLDRLDDLAVEHGLHVTDTWAVRFDGPDAGRQMAAVMETVRDAAPTELAGMAVTRVHDYLTGDDDLPPTDAVLLELGDRARVLVRPSGTEPKAKLYLEVMAPTSRTTLAADRDAARRTIGSLRSALAARLGLDPA